MTAVQHAPVPRSAAAARAWRGSALLSRGFRPFFLGAGVWALVGMALWPAVFSGAVAIPTAFSPVDWHAHEMIFGYGAAVIAGFLLTAIPNWTGRLPVAGAPLAALAALWIAGRAAVFASSAIPRPAAAIVDAGFLVVFAALVAREVVAGGNWRNLKVAALALALGLANVAFHVEDARAGFADHSIRAALGLVVMLILLIGGRVTPNFTGNWIARNAAGPRPAPAGRADAIVLALSGFALVAWAAAPEGVAAGVLALAAGAGNLWRLSRWRGFAARRDPLVVALHAGYLLAALGFVAAGASALWPARIPYAVGVHVWAVGAVGMMTLAMMTRATLGHTGHALVASRTTVFAYLCIAVALAARIVMAMAPDAALLLMHVAACAWAFGFAAFLFAYAPMLIRRSGPG
ncbi:uncharacterized protein involved in response to NO [Roseiarcus fermentans]|uniref:Uncharacterized protein involved in response to NO n=1 Tax=Roseiarcus fermentans TaxID=1473586 RepID=A0A366EKZ8_9HYPH|nr:NnrS family protein [Roseiarcus fermentans]RBP03038.1 uncharacterized protein involved in response to NO [Roseiarcus fermentans]